jgi:CheY-like chemotaxis protein
MGIINDILDYAKLDIGKINLDIKCMNLYECIETTNDIVLSKIYEKSLVYNYNIGYNIPENIYGDSNRIKQVLLNILSNSIKFMEKGNIFLNIKTISKDEFDLFYNKYKSNNTNSNFDTHNDEYHNQMINKYNLKDGKEIHIRFDITDSGCGIDSLHKDKIFEPFTQISNNLSSKIYPGTGLGLSICKELIELMGGVIWLDWSELDVGSTFSFILPMYISDNNTILNESCVMNNNVLKNANVLIVDDNLYNRISLSGIMNKWGMVPYVYSNGQEALYFSRIINFDIGLIDICMPNMDGLSFVKKLRNQNEFNNKTIPLIALSSLGDKTEINPNYFKTNLIKPIKESKLKTICIDLLQKRVVNNKITTNNDIKVLDEYIINNNILDLKKNIRILVAEDVYINQKIIMSFLNKLGFNNIIMVNDGKECLNLALNNDFDIILLDIIMPLLSGEVVIKELTKHYLENPEHIKPYIIAVTAYCLRNDKEYYLNIGFDDYIVKPVDINELNKILNKHIENLLEK